MNCDFIVPNTESRPSNRANPDPVKLLGGRLFSLNKKETLLYVSLTIFLQQ